jgi:hypothetical protein
MARGLVFHPGPRLPGCVAGRRPGAGQHRRPLLKLLFGARQAAAVTPSAAPSVLDGILQLQSLGTFRTTSTLRLSLGGSLLGSDFLQQAALVCAAVQVARSRKNFSLVRPYL